MLGGLINVPINEATFLANSCIKTYPSFTQIYYYKSEKAIIDDGFVPSKKLSKSRIGKLSNEDLLRSIRRSRTTIHDIAICNEFEYFATFTFKNQRQDVNKCKERMSQWFKDQRKNGHNLSYLTVPEFHKDGKSIHFHALIKGHLNLTPTNIYQKGRQIYNIKNYRNGFTTVVKIDNLEAVSKYIRKYITKDMPQFNNKKRYWCSKDLVRPKLEWKFLMEDDFAQFIHIFENDYLHLYQKPNTIQAQTKSGG